MNNQLISSLIQNLNNSIYPNACIITEKDNGKVLSVNSSVILIIFCLVEKTGSGFQWNKKELIEQGLTILIDVNDTGNENFSNENFSNKNFSNENFNNKALIGSDTLRIIFCKYDRQDMENCSENKLIKIQEIRSWDPSLILNKLSIVINLW